MDAAASGALRAGIGTPESPVLIRPLPPAQPGGSATVQPKIDG